jgi:hypothetical protein
VHAELELGVVVPEEEVAVLRLELTSLSAAGKREGLKYQMPTLSNYY